MPSSELLKNYELAEPTIRGLYDSKLRLAILDALKDGPMRLADLRRVVGANAPNTSTKAKDLEEMGIVERVEGDFQLTPYGKAVREKSQEMLGFYATYETFKEFWEKHNTEVIPDFLWQRLGDLRNSKILKGADYDVTEYENEFLRMIGSAKKFLYLASPVYHDDYLAALLSVLETGADTQVIVSEDVIKKASRVMGKKNLVSWDNSKNCHFLEFRNLSFGFAVSENFFTLILTPITSGVSYMFVAPDLRSTDPRAIRWGLDLFEFYKKQSKPIKLSDYL